MTRPTKREVEDEFLEWVQLLCEALQACEGHEDRLKRLPRDLWTPREAKQFNARWRVAQALIDGRKPTEVARERKVTHRLVEDVAKFAVEPVRTNGYAEVYERVKQQRAAREKLETPA
jgi:uncharacterized protein YerC